MKLSKTIVRRRRYFKRNLLRFCIPRSVFSRMHYCSDPRRNFSLFLLINYIYGHVGMPTVMHHWCDSASFRLMKSV